MRGYLVCILCFCTVVGSGSDTGYFSCLFLLKRGMIKTIDGNQIRDGDELSAVSWELSFWKFLTIAPHSSTATQWH